jgi:transcription initiation factor TFIIIB Brf1 subunit/transcription initiation factor TFIIB
MWMNERHCKLVSETLPYITFLDQLSIRLKVRRRIAATATVYFYRVFEKQSGRNLNTVASACLFLASKVEECPINIKEISGLSSNLEISDILDMELFVLQDLEFSLIVFHPYPLLNRYLTDMGHADCLSMAWNVMNDLYKNSIILQYSPHSLALGVIFFVLVFKNVELKDSCWSGERFNSVEAACIIQNLLIVYNEMKFI